MGLLLSLCEKGQGVPERALGGEMEGLPHTGSLLTRVSLFLGALWWCLVMKKGVQPEVQGWSRKESRLQECSLGDIPMGEVEGEDGKAGLSNGESSGDWYPCLYIVTWE